MSCRIVSNHGHFEVYVNGEFYCSADTMAEAIHEVTNDYSNRTEINHEQISDGKKECEK